MVELFRDEEVKVPDAVVAQPLRGQVGHVVGIGSSAGGLEALLELVSHLSVPPAGNHLAPGVAYVVAQHKARGQLSVLVDLLARATPLKVVTAVDGAHLEADQIFVCPPNYDISLVGDLLRLTKPQPRFGPSPNIDLLFESIAAHWQHRGVAIVLSGTGSDGARGIRALRAAGGISFAQDPSSAKFDAMPWAAINLGGADLVYVPAAMGPRLLEMLATHGELTTQPLVQSEPVLLQSVMVQLRQSTGFDFSLYKESTLLRQIERRMLIREVRTLDDYQPLLLSDRSEAQALVQNLLVAVTAFFRDPQAYEALQLLLKAYLEQRPGKHRLRVWVAGCSTGEEAYSIAMLIGKLFGFPIDLQTRLKIFASDLDEASLAIARRAIYPLIAAQDIPEEMHAHYLIERDGEIEITKELRSCVVFARHNICEDPPFPSIDLISCRNTLIYFTAPLQERVLRLLGFSLDSGGLLLLGNSESINSKIPGFVVANGVQKIYVRTSEPLVLGRLPARASLLQHPTGASSVTRRIGHLREVVPEQHLAMLQSLVQAICPPSMVLDEDHELVEVIGDITPYCRIPQGRLTSVASSFLREELQSEARSLFLMSRSDSKKVVSNVIKLVNSEQMIQMEARPIVVDERSLLLLSFIQILDCEHLVVETVSGDRDAAFGKEIERLERELLRSQDSLRRSLAELEQANEELEASSEELQASSEELQSSNEELEASNEELQATNEELGTLNQQLRSRGDQLERLNIELENIQSSLSQGMVIVDRSFCITRYSPLAVRVFGLVESDIGQSLMGVPTTIPLPGLRSALLAVIGGESRRIIEAFSDDVSYLVQVLPYQERDGRRLGAIITLTDVSEIMALRQASENSLEIFTHLTESLEEVVWKRDYQMEHILYISSRVEPLTGWSAVEISQQPELLDQRIDPEDQLRVKAARDLSQGGWSIDYRLRVKDGRLCWLHESAKVVDEANDHYVVGTLRERDPLLPAQSG
ncbi:MAG TPA: diguanylate cyclase [Synechococcales bacterium UBA10510]|nr:diguanylate cyclase [Synechococcales bacterium UBA10510]